MSSLFRDWCSSSRQAHVTAARPSHAVAAPPADVPYAASVTGTSRQTNAAQRTALPAAGVPGARRGRRPASAARARGPG
ncbi:hypothetical protein ACFQ60_20020 [Streptomyces zhihengii]